MIEKIIHNTTQNPKTLFLVDGMGAVLTAILLGLVLPRYESFFGIPSHMLNVLATIPVLYLSIDIYAFYKSEVYMAKLLRIVARLNFLYCILSLGMALLHFQNIQIWGWIYIVIEFIIIVLLARFEMSIANQLVDKTEQ